MGSRQTGFLRSGIPWNYNQKILRMCWAIFVPRPTRAVLHLSLHHSVPWKADLYTLDQSGYWSLALAGDLRPGEEESLDIYPLAPTLLVCISLPKPATPALSQFQDHILPSNFRSGLVTAPDPRSHHSLLISLHPVHDSSVVPLKYNSCVTGDQYRHVLLFFWTQFQVIDFCTVLNAPRMKSLHSGSFTHVIPST